MYWKHQKQHQKLLLPLRLFSSNFCLLLCPAFFDDPVHEKFIEVGQHCQPRPGCMVEQDRVKIS